MATSSTKTSDTKGRGFSLGRTGFSKISAVEGIFLTDEMRRDFHSFDDKGLSPEERRRSIISKYGKQRA